MTTTDSVVDKCVEFLLAEILEQPRLVVAFPGENTTFRCSGTGNIFWRVNDTLFDFTNADFFTEHGICSEVSYDGNPQLAVGSLTVQTSFPTYNNTLFRCTVMDTEREVINNSQSASLFIVGECSTLNPCPHAGSTNRNYRAWFMNGGGWLCTSCLLGHIPIYIAILS